MIRFFLFFFLIIFNISLFAQSQFNISGRVRAESSGDELVGAHVYLPGTNIGTTTNKFGAFKISNLPAGQHQVAAGFVGYTEQSITVNLINNDTSIVFLLNQELLEGPMISTISTRARERVSPVTFSNLEKERLEAVYSTQDFPELLSELPSTTFYSEGGSGIGYNYMSIRGFGQRRISVMINGVPQNDPEDHNTYWVNFPGLTDNIQSIQVQRGAGTAFYGPAAIGGSINIQTNYFSPQRKYKLAYGIGSFGTQKMSAEINSGLLADKFVLYGRLSNLKTDGYRERAWVDFWSYFLGAAIYSGNHNLRIHFYGGPIEDGLVYGGLPKRVNDDNDLRRKNYSWWTLNDQGTAIDFATERRSDEVENFNQPHLEVLHEYKIDDHFSLNNTAYFIRGYGFFDYDGSWVGYYPDWQEYFRLTPEFGYEVDSLPSDALIRAYVDNTQAGWYPQLVWRKGKEEFVFGAEFRMHRSVHWGRLQKGAGLPSNVVGDNGRHYYQYKGAKDIISLYYHQTHELWKNLIIMGDLQYTYKKYHLYDEKFVETDFTIPYSFFNPRLGMNYNFSPVSNLYLSMSITNREPRLKNFYDAAEASTPASWREAGVSPAWPQFELNPDSTYNYSKPLVKPETLAGLEIGYQYRAERFRGSVNFYHMNFVNEIIKSGGLDRFGQPVTGNAERTLHQGVELSAAWQIIPQLTLSANGLISSNKLVAYTVYDDAGNPINLDDNPIAGFPDNLANVRLDYAWRGLQTSIGMKYVGKFYTDNFKNEANTVDPYSVFNLTFRYKTDKLGISGVTLQGRINNLLNTKYLAHGEGDNFFPAATRHYFVGLQFEY